GPGVPDAARPDATVGPDATVTTADAALPPPDAAVTTTDGAVALDAAVGLDAEAPRPDAARADAARPDAARPDANGGGDDAGLPRPDAGRRDAGQVEECVPGCQSIRERRLCPAGGAPLVVECTADTECHDGVCTEPQPTTEPPAQGACSCRAGSAPEASAWLALAALALLRSRRRRG
ncbi:MAG: MYXO-CTERM sorting domain-containing protein, partial [Myxococcota bacterium]